MEESQKMQYIAVEDACGGEVGVGVGGAGGGSNNKKITKQAFTDSMQKLATSLKLLHYSLKVGNCNLASERLKKDVTGELNKISELVSYNGHPSYGL